MLIASVAAVITFFLPPQVSVTSNPEVTVLDAKLGGDCSADFTVKDADGKPVYAASVHVRVHYGFWNIKRADLEVGTNSDGRARLEHLPNKAKPLLYEITKDGKTASAQQNVSERCHGAYEVSLK